MTIKIIDDFWQRYRLYEELLLEIGMKPVKYDTWLARYKKHNASGFLFNVALGSSTHEKI